MSLPMADESGGIINDREVNEVEDIVEDMCELDLPVELEHSWWHGVFISFSLSLCITVDILQYSMPLAFLPSVLEDRGHAPMKIATAIGVYYWTGFVGCLIITSYQVWRVVSGEGLDRKEEDAITLRQAKRQIRYLIYGLMFGTATLTCQALSPHYNVHLYCRFIQGFAGAFLFFYTFLLSVSLFQPESDLRTFAMTSAATALNIAEVLGSLFGAVIYAAWGQRMVYWILGITSLLAQGLLVIVLLSLKTKPREDHHLGADGESDVSNSGIPSGASVTSVITTESARLRRANSGWERLMAMLKSPRLGCTVLLIVTAAIVKGSVEEMLPFHADHQWHYDPLGIGTLFSIIAVAYILSAMLTGKLWNCLDRFRVPFGALWLGLLGFAAYGVFATRSYTHDKRYLYGFLMCYGACLGFTHTPAALLLGDAIDHEEGPAKEAANGIWNTMWEAGGSLGFLLGGVLAHNYEGQLELLGAYIVMCIFGAAGVIALGLYGDHCASLPSRNSARSLTDSLNLSKMEEINANYGATMGDDDIKDTKS